MGHRDSTSAALLLPRPALAGCLYVAILRDTRAQTLTDEARFNFFPASPLCSVTWFFEGESRLVAGPPVFEGGAEGEPMLTRAFTGPQTRPTVSWNPGPVHALTMGLYPEAWRLLARDHDAAIVDTNTSLEAVAGDAFLDACAALDGPGTVRVRWATFQELLEPVWQRVRPDRSSGGGRLQDWTRAIAARAVTSGPGRSARQVQRRIRGWTGQSLRDLEAFARTERLFGKALTARSSGEVDLARLATEAGFSDQSHMGRHVRRVTGLPPARLNALIRDHEAFWAYRLLGERL